MAETLSRAFLPFFVSLASAPALAQQSKSPPASKEALPPASQPVLTLKPGQLGGSPAYSTDGRALPPRAGEVLPRAASPRPRIPWNRLAFGAWIDAGNAGVFNSWLVLSRDEVLKDSVSEFGFGFGLFADFPTPGGDANEGLRLKVGAKKMAFKGVDAVLATDPAADLETGGTLLSASLVHRWELPVHLPGLWVGLGGGFDYVFSSKRNGLAGPPSSQLANAYGFKGLVALGVDIPLTSIHDVSGEITWQPISGFSVMLGGRIEM